MPANVKRFFLTWPQIADIDDVGVEEAARMVRRYLKKNGYRDQWIVLGKEDHEESGSHYHCAVQLRKVSRVSMLKLFDGIFEKHGNYQKMKGSARKAIKYVIKEGTFCALGIDVDAAIKKVNAQGGYRCMQLIAHGMNLKKIREEMPGYYITNMPKIKSAIAMEKVFKEPEKEEWFRFNLSNVWYDKLEEPKYQIMKWVNENLKMKRMFKQEQLYIHGEHNLGKTTLVNYLEKYFRIYYMPHEDFYDHWDDDEYDLVVIDEFKGRKLIQWMNQFLQGSTMPLRIKGGQILKRSNPAVIILSNYNLEGAYCNSDQDKLESLRCRLKIIEVNEYLDITDKDLEGYQGKSDEQGIKKKLRFSNSGEVFGGEAIGRKRPSATCEELDKDYDYTKKRAKKDK